MPQVVVVGVSALRPNRASATETIRSSPWRFGREIGAILVPMAGHEAPDRLRRRADPPQAVVLGVSVRSDRNAPARAAAVQRAAPFSRRAVVASRVGRAVVALGIVGALAAAVVGSLDHGKSATRRQPVNVAARQSGAAGVAAVYGHPLDCLSITILPGSPTYARADFNHASPCGRYTGYPTAIFHYASGAWRGVLEAVSYQCPVASLPVAVQRALAVCL